MGLVESADIVTEGVIKGSLAMVIPVFLAALGTALVLKFTKRSMIGVA